MILTVNILYNPILITEWKCFKERKYFTINIKNNEKKKKKINKTYKTHYHKKSKIKELKKILKNYT